MNRWVLYSFLSMAFAGATSVIAKFGLSGISADLGVVVRTAFVFAMVAAFAAFSVPAGDVAHLTRANLGWLALSALTTTVSWIFYYRAIQIGEISTIALIDKGSFVVAVLLAWLLLRETITLRVGIGMALILAGLLVAAKR